MELAVRAKNIFFPCPTQMTRIKSINIFLYFFDRSTETDILIVWNYFDVYLYLELLIQVWSNISFLIDAK
jgi:hypothetical protein